MGLISPRMDLPEPASDTEAQPRSDVGEGELSLSDAGSQGSGRAAPPASSDSGSEQGTYEDQLLDKGACLCGGGGWGG